MVLGAICSIADKISTIRRSLLCRIWDWEVVEIEQAADRPPKELFFIPALLLVALIYLLQMRRKTRLEQGA